MLMQCAKILEISWQSTYLVDVEMLKKEDLPAIHELFHPTRITVYNMLKGSEDGLYAGEIAQKLDLDRKLVAFHLAELEKLGFVKSEFRVMTPNSGAPPKAARYYETTGRAEDLVKRIKTTMVESAH
jgi:predicted ArsR family transcriptional regulator